MADSDSSSDSDDDFLTQRDDRKVDREAIVRKKLLESFYGKTAVASVPSADQSDDDEDGESPAKMGTRSFDSAAEDDIDSASFDVNTYAERQIRDSSIHALLDEEERLALEVRTLDSTMQTLVYENYSRFIDATDAIRSIGVNVQANEQGLQRLTEAVHKIDDQARSVEEALGSLRDQVAEKIRVKRLLSRLDALLKLPETLREQIRAGKYRSATKSYLSASSILSKHSEGFESLKTIETECNSILIDLRKELKRKILHWSGRVTVLETISGESDDEGVGMADTDQKVPDPPQNMTEVFECAGTLFILLEHDAKEGVEVEADLNADDLQSMVVAAAMRLLDRLLDAHLIEMQERRFAAPGMELSGSIRGLEEPTVSIRGASLIPRDFLDAMLEGATLYGVTFSTVDQAGSGCLMEFVSEAFASFLSHMRSVLWEESIHANREDTTPATENDAEEDLSQAQNEISSALSLLVQSVRELASGLALPEVGINVEYASTLVDQVMELTESMVRRQVDQKFHDLRLGVVRECLLPFASRAVEEREHASKDGKPALPQIIQIASTTLSDCLQLVDDAIRSVFSDSASSNDLPDLRDAVHASAFRFACWLANAFEILAGSDLSDNSHLADAPMEGGDGSEREGVVSMEGLDLGPGSGAQDDVSDLPDQDATLVDLMDTASTILLNGSQRKETGTLDSDYILAIVELCRLAAESLPENLEQSVASHLGGGKKKSRGLFPRGEVSQGDKVPDEEEDKMSKCFRVASSRVLVLYATNCGTDAANTLCSDLAEEALKSEDCFPTGPRPAAVEVLCIAKKVAIECATLFGGDQRAGPVPEWEDVMSGLSNPVLSRKTGLQLDVERIFKEHVTIYPHPSEIMEASRNAVLFLFFKITFRALIENARLHSFSATGFCQVQADVEFLKHMLPHYVSSDFSDKGTNACSALSSLLADVAEIVEERCIDGDYDSSENSKRQAREAVGSFMSSFEDSDAGERFVIDED
jgi:hypothetical protein